MEGCYIPFDRAKDFDAQSRKEIRFFCLVMSERYIQNHFDNILDFASVIESRKVDRWTKNDALAENAKMLEQCKAHNARCILIDDEYCVGIAL